MLSRKGQKVNLLKKNSNTSNKGDHIIQTSGFQTEMYKQLYKIAKSTEIPFHDNKQKRLFQTIW